MTNAVAAIEPVVDIPTKKEKKEKKKRKQETNEPENDKEKLSQEERLEKKRRKEERRLKKKSKSANPEQSIVTKPSAMEDQDIMEWLVKHEIALEDNYKSVRWYPYLSFKDLTCVETKVMAITSKFDRPTPIQSMCWPIQLGGRDVIGIAETGSGKTLAFGIPALNHIVQQKDFGRCKKPLALVLAPTRELAMQIHEQFKEAGAACGVKSLCVFGGMPKHEQVQQLKQGVHVVIACPGRLLDLCQEGSCDLSQVTYAILDEADRMLDMGFEAEVRAILGMTSKQRQTLMFSATWPNSIRKLAQEFLREPVKVTVGSPDLGANQNIKQIVEVLSDGRDKEQKLIELLNKYHSSRKNRILVFALYKKEAARLESMLQKRGWNCAAIHGDMSQHERNTNFAQFKSGQVPLLIATDVAARGLDIPNVEYVINVTFPLTIEDYVHRIGRTGRAGKKGVAHTFFTMHDKLRAGELINVLKDTNQEVPESLMAFGTTVKKKEHTSYGAFFREVDPNVKGTKITFGNGSDSE